MLSSKLKNKHKSSQTFTDDTVLVFDAIGTSWKITTNQSISSVARKQLSKAIDNRIEQFDKDYSRFRADSLLTAMSKQTGVYSLPGDAKPLFDLYELLYMISDGLVTPLVGNLLSQAGYNESYRLTSSYLSPVPNWDEAVAYSFPTITIKQPVLLDVGAAGKGYLVDIVAEVMQAAGIDNFCINAGGDIKQVQSSFHSESIGLEHPINLDEVVGVADLYNQSLCGSSTNRRAWGEFHHIINPKTQTSPRQLLSVWVVADSTLLADGLATALFFVSPEKLRKYFIFEYALIMDDLSLEYSDGFPAEFFAEEKITSQT